MSSSGGKCMRANAGCHAGRRAPEIPRSGHRRLRGRRGLARAPAHAGGRREVTRGADDAVPDLAHRRLAEVGVRPRGVQQRGRASCPVRAPNCSGFRTGADRKQLHVWGVEVDPEHGIEICRPGIIDVQPVVVDQNTVPFLFAPKARCCIPQGLGVPTRDRLPGANSEPVRGAASRPPRSDWPPSGMAAAPLAWYEPAPALIHAGVGPARTRRQHDVALRRSSVGPQWTSLSIAAGARRRARVRIRLGRVSSSRRFGICRHSETAKQVPFQPRCISSRAQKINGLRHETQFGTKGAFSPNVKQTDTPAGPAGRSPGRCPIRR